MYTKFFSNTMFDKNNITPTNFNEPYAYFDNLCLLSDAQGQNV